MGNRQAKGGSGPAERLRRVRGAAGGAALLVTHLPDVRYLTGFTGSNAVLALLGRRAVLFTDSRYASQVREQVPRETGVTTRVVKHALDEALRLLAAGGAQTIAFDGEHLPVAALERMRRGLPAGVSRRLLRAARPWPLPGLRECKDGEELEQMTRAAELTCALFDAILPHLEPGRKEREVAAELEYLARSQGAEGMSFDTIVASGPRSSLPHGTASDQALPRRGFVTLDFGIILGGYCSDMTRTVYLGKPGVEEKQAYEAVLSAQEDAVGFVRAGVPVSQVDAAAREVLKARGLGKFFTHSTGHGVGLEIHEGPRLAASAEGTLAAGMVVTVEPGVYLPGRWGIRIEDMVAVTEDGGRVLTAAAPKQLICV